MRLMARLHNGDAARAVSDFLTTQGVENHLVDDDDGTVSLWIAEDDQIEKARTLLEQAARGATPEESAAVRRMAAEVKATKRRREENIAERMIDVRKDWHRQTQMTLGILTTILIGISIGVTLLESLQIAPELSRRLFISEYLMTIFPLPPEVGQGEVWRLITPIFLHFGITHILFNMMWLKDLGSVIEYLKGTGHFALLVLAIGLSSNLAQYFVSGPLFGGMSGVVYGLFGYIWMMARFDPASGFRLDKNTVVLMMVWFVVCITGLVGPIANTAHGVGLAVGVIWGFVAAQIRQQRVRMK